MKNSVILDKSYSFALKIIKVYQYLSKSKKEFELSRQILRSGTSIGANSEEATGAQSRKDFIAKFSIAYKEARETNYWLRLLKDSGYIEEKQANELINDCTEIQKIIASILVSSKRN
jgi:four helix bundle protein